MTNNQPHPNPKDVEAWMVSLGFEHKANFWALKGDKDMLTTMSNKAGNLLYTIHHTALTSFRDEVLEASPEDYVQDQRYLPLFKKGFNTSNDKWREAIQTISQRHGI